MENRVHFRKTLYFRMIILILFLGVTFFAALLCIYRVSCRRFEEELSYHSNALMEQVCRNVDLTLKEMSEKAVPLIATNERLGPALREVHKGNYYEEPPYLKLRIENHLGELMGMNYSVNWMAVVDRREYVYLTCRDSRIRGPMPNEEDILTFFRTNEENLSRRQGQTIWVKGRDCEGVILMRSVFDSDTMSFCGCIMAELESKPLEEIFEAIDSEKVGIFTLYDRNGAVLYSTGSISKDVKDRDIFQTEYVINRGMLKLVHMVDIREKNQNFSELLYLMVTIGMLVLVIIIGLLWIMFGKMAKNLKIILGNLHRVSVGEFELMPSLFTKGDELDVVALNIQDMSQRIKRLMEQVVHDKEIQEQNRYKLLEMRYHELQSQVNPHFLFNILQSINGIAQINGDERVSRLICMLSKFFRGNVDRRYTSCELKEELEYARNYMELYKNIYPERLDIQWNVDENLLCVTIPTYILQPIVENSLVHGMEPSLGVCTIRISVYSIENKLIIEVWDSGEGIEEEKLKVLLDEETQTKRVGIRNVRDRIQILYGKEYGLLIESEYHQYTQVRIVLPLP